MGMAVLVLGKSGSGKSTSLMEWRPVVGFEGLYEVSNTGEIRSRKSGHYRLLKKKHNKVTGYDYVILHNGGPATRSVHRLVAMSFLPNPDDLPYVNHKDEDKTNNAASNLEWCTAQYNTDFSKKKRYKRIAAYSSDGEKIAMFESTTIAANLLGVSKSAISNTLARDGSTCHGLKLAFEGDGE